MLQIINDDYTQELKTIEYEAIIECMQVELERIEKKLEIVLAYEQKLLHQQNSDNFGEVLYKRYGSTYMNPEVNKNKIKNSPCIQFSLRIVSSYLIVFFGGGG